MNVQSRIVKSILTAQKAGFLAAPPYPFTHSLSPYIGCGFGTTACGAFCYAQFMPNWQLLADKDAWGGTVAVKVNAPDVLYDTLAKMPQHKRAALRIFMSTTTDPYQGLEAKHGVTKDCLEVFKQFDDLDLLVIQTRSPLVQRDFDLLADIPYAWLSMTVETDDQSVVSRLGGGPAVSKRIETVKAAKQRGLNAQIVVSPCLPYTPSFADELIATRADRIVIDDFVDGDGAGGRRTANTAFAGRAWFDWRDNSAAHALMRELKSHGIDVSWSSTGFCGIPSRTPLQQPLFSD